MHREKKEIEELRGHLNKLEKLLSKSVTSQLGNRVDKATNASSFLSPIICLYCGQGGHYRK